MGEPEKILLQRIQEEQLPCILCINKIDTVEKKESLLEVIAAYNEVYSGFDAIIPLSARTGDGLDDLLAQLAKYAQPGPQLFPDGMTTDQADSQVCAEIVREKLLRCLDKEIPPRHGGGGDEVLRAGGHRGHRPGRDHLLRKGQPQGHYHRQRRGNAQAHQPRRHGGTLRNYGNKGIYGDVGEGEGELAGQSQLYPQPGLQRGLTAWTPARPSSPGVVLRITDTKETDKILTVLSPQLGRSRSSHGGARRKNSRLAAACQLLAYDELTVYKRGAWYLLDEAATLELFPGVRRDIVQLSLASWFAELTEAVCPEEAPAPELAALLLNGLYALCYLEKDPVLVEGGVSVAAHGAGGISAVHG